MKRILALLVMAAMCFGLITVSHAAEMKFTDVKETDWFYADVKTAVESGLVNGKTATTYAPDDNLTYAEAIKLAACMNQLYTTGVINLTNGTPWYQTYVDYCTKNGIISMEYNYGENATRAGYMTIFANALPDEGLKAINTIADGSIPDVPKSAAYAQGVYKLYRAGILQGVDAAHNCNPMANIKRSEVAAILTRMMNADKRVKFSMGTSGGGTSSGGSGSGGSGGSGGGSSNDEEFEISIQPENVEIISGEVAELFVEVDGGKKPYSYQWKILTVAPGGMETWFDITDNSVFSGADTDTLSAKLESVDERKVYCVITDKNGDTAESDIVTITTKANPETALKFVTQPEDLTFEVGTGGALKVEVAGGKEPYTYSWQFMGSNSTWSAIGVNPFFSGVDSDSLIIDVTEPDEGKFRCVVTDSEGAEIISDEVTLVVNPKSLAIEIQPTDKTGIAGIGILQEIAVSGGKEPYTYQWQFKNGEKWIDFNDASDSAATISGSKTNSFVLKSPDESAFTVRCVVTDGDGTSLESDEATITFTKAVSNEEFKIAFQPQSTSAELGTTAKLMVSVKNGKEPYTYEWQLNVNKTWTRLADNDYISGAKTYEISLSPSKTGIFELRCIITDADGNKLTSNKAVVVIK